LKLISKRSESCSINQKNRRSRTPLNLRSKTLTQKARMMMKNTNMIADITKRTLPRSVIDAKSLDILKNGALKNSKCIVGCA